ncbi:hypothetical protein BH10BAC2_BH10BAC2_14360 [soil metagenome]
MKKYSLLLTIVLLIVTQVGHTQRFNITKDIYAGTNSDFSEMETYNGITYFSANDGIHGSEVWRTDGTTSGTYMVADINEGIGNSYPYDFTACGGVIFFKAYVPIYGMELWKTDGTKEGTVMVKDIWKGYENGLYGSEYPNYLTDVNGTLYFAANSPVAGQELWKSDGTEAGTVMVKDLNRRYGSEPEMLEEYNGKVYFFAGGDNSRGFYISDGTDSGTVLIQTVNRYSLFDHLSALNIFVYKNLMYFVNNDNANKYGYELWRSDGTTKGTYMFKDINPGSLHSQPSEFIEAGGIFFFEADHKDYGNELWKTDGTPEGTVLVKDITPGISPGTTDIESVARLNGKVYFHYNIYKNDNIEEDQLWQSDGSDVGTTFVADYTGTSALTFTTAFLFFNKKTASYGNELWKSDGTTEGTVIVKDILQGSYNSVQDYLPPVVADNIVFNHAQNDTTGFELWKSNGSAEGTLLVKDINQGTTPGSNVKMITPYNGKLFFAARHHIYGYQPFISDGTSNGTFVLKDTTPPPVYAKYDAFEFKGLLYFYNYLKAFGNSNTAVQQLWQTDGTVQGTELYADSTSINSTGHITPAQDVIYFTNKTRETGAEIWKTDGKKKNSVLVKDINPGSAGSQATLLTHFRGILYFRATDGIHGEELWRSDGTKDGTYMIKDLQPGASSSKPKGFFAYKKWLYFSTDFNKAMWRTDGTAEGTEQIYNSNSGEVFVQSGNLVVSADMLLFSANNSVVGKELWKTDGKTNTGTLVKDITPGIANTYFSDMTDVNGILFFTKSNQGNYNAQNYLWKTDGTESGTKLVKDIFPSEDNFMISSLLNVNGQLCFLAESNANSYPTSNQIWVSDGTEEGTVQIYDDNLAGVNISSPMLNINDKLFFVAGNQRYGDELWSGSLPPLSVSNDNTIIENVIFKPVNMHVKALPNPFTSSLIISLEQCLAGKVNVTISNIVGNVLIKQSHILSNGNNLLSYNTAFLLPGIYFLHVKRDDGFNETIKIIKF